MTAFPIPDAALDDRLGFVGTSGSGKTYNAGAAVERLLVSGARVVIVDPLDVWWGLRLSADGKREGFKLPIFGGAHGDLPLNERAGKLIGETVAAMGESCIVSLGEMPTKEAERRFMLDFLETLYRKAKGSPFHVVFDEADLWAPQGAGSGSGPMLQSLMEQIVRRGRVKGFIPWLITQRPAVISKDVLSQVDGLVTFKLTSSHDRKAIGEWVKGQADLEQWNAIWAQLPAMQRGEGVVWVPARGLLDTVKFPLKLTFDSSRAPKRGEKREARDLKPLDLDKLKGRLSTIEEDAKANDPAALKAEVAALKRELAKLERAKAAPQVPVIANAEQLEAARAEGERVGIAMGIARARSAIDALRVDGVSTGAVAAPTKRKPQPVPPVTIGAGQGVTAGETAIPSGTRPTLAVLVSTYPAGMTSGQIAARVGIKKKGSTFSAYKSRLRTAGLIEERGGLIYASEAGVAAIGDVEPMPEPGPELARSWATKLPGTGPIVEYLLEFHPNWCGREEIADALHINPTGSTLSAYISRLFTAGVIEKSGSTIRLSPDVMP